MVRPLEAVRDRHVACCHVDDPPGYEERRDPPGSALLQGDSGVGNPLHTTDTGTDSDARRDLVVIGRGVPAGVIERLTRGTHCVEDEIVDLALLLGFHPLVGVEAAVATVTA